MKRIVFFFFMLVPLIGSSFDWNIETGAFNRIVEDESYMVLSLKPEIKISKFYASLDLEFSFDEDGKFKERDWDTWRAVVEKIAFIGYGKPRDELVFFRFGLLDDVSLGYGILVNHFRNDIYYPEIKKMGFFGGYDIGYNGLTFFMEDTLDIDLFGGRVFFRPLYGLKKELPDFIKNFQVGFSFVMDRDPYDQDTSDGDKVLAKDSSESETTKAFAIDIGFPLLKNNVIKLDNYVQYGDLVDMGAGVGYGFKGYLIEIIEYKAEVNYSWDGFIPQYFSSFYAIRDIRKNQKAVAMSADNGFGYLIGIYSTFFKEQFKIGAEFSDNEKQKPQFNFYTYLEPNLLGGGFLKLNYQRKEIDGFVDAFDFTRTKGNTLLQVEAGYKITENALVSILYVKNYQEINGVVHESSLTEIQTKILF